eukprot:TRINITY_DN6128_c0_g1_i2.p1 TRINITY_DN6128_c0_g1~~TRINITY_DN6128_c0_g1_i2.p1  ORF type:complete len:912 (-),score=203.80 TRINITY_DN6128_c0_g1_i2:300-3035(-)
MTIDTTPPIPGDVSVNRYQTSRTRIAASWTGFEDAESGIQFYDWAVTTTPGQAPGTVANQTVVDEDISLVTASGYADELEPTVIPFTWVPIDANRTHSFERTGLLLELGRTYFGVLRAWNGANSFVEYTTHGITILTDQDAVVTLGSDQIVEVGVGDAEDVALSVSVPQDVPGDTIVIRYLDGDELASLALADSELTQTDIPLNVDPSEYEDAQNFKFADFSFTITSYDSEGSTMESQAFLPPVVVDIRFDRLADVLDTSGKFMSLDFFDTESQLWISTTEACVAAGMDPEEALPTVDYDQFTLVFKICHFTQFALNVRSVAVPSPTTTPQFPSDPVLSEAKKDDESTESSFGSFGSFSASARIPVPFVLCLLLAISAVLMSSSPRLGASSGTRTSSSSSGSPSRRVTSASTLPFLVLLVSVAAVALLTPPVSAHYAPRFHDWKSLALDVDVSPVKLAESALSREQWKRDSRGLSSVVCPADEGVVLSSTRTDANEVVGCEKCADYEVLSEDEELGGKKRCKCDLTQISNGFCVRSKSARLAAGVQIWEQLKRLPKIQSRVSAQSDETRIESYWNYCWNTCGNDLPYATAGTTNELLFTSGGPAKEAGSAKTVAYCAASRLMFAMILKKLPGGESVRKIMIKSESCKSLLSELGDDQPWFDPLKAPPRRPSKSAMLHPKLAFYSGSSWARKELINRKFTAWDSTPTGKIFKLAFEKQFRDTTASGEMKPVIGGSFTEKRKNFIEKYFHKRMGASAYGPVVQVFISYDDLPFLGRWGRLRAEDRSMFWEYHGKQAYLNPYVPEIHFFLQNPPVEKADEVTCGALLNWAEDELKPDRSDKLGGFARAAALKAKAQEKLSNGFAGLIDKKFKGFLQEYKERCPARDFDSDIDFDKLLPAMTCTIIGEPAPSPPG